MIYHILSKLLTFFSKIGAKTILIQANITRTETKSHKSDQYRKFTSILISIRIIFCKSSLK